MANRQLSLDFAHSFSLENRPVQIHVRLYKWFAAMFSMKHRLYDATD